MHRIFVLGLLVGLVGGIASVATGQGRHPSPAPPFAAGGVAGSITSTPSFDISQFGIEQLSFLGSVRDMDLGASPLQNPALTVSQLDLRAPKGARRQFEKGFQLFSGKQYQPARDHFLQALAIYPKYVAAHNALGSAYLALNRNDDARSEFAQAAVLDPHLPAPFLNLAYAEFAMQHYASALVASQRAASMAPLDLSALTAVAYAQLMTKDYAGTISTTDKIHQRNQGGHSVVHLYAAAASENEGNLSQARDELQTLIKEDPKSAAASAARDLLTQWKTSENTALSADGVAHPAEGSAPAQTKFQQEIALQTTQDTKEQAQVAEAEAMCESCETETTGPSVTAPSSASSEKGFVLRSNVNEVAVWFVATDHGKPVRDLTQSEVTVRDAGKPPAAVVPSVPRTNFLCVWAW